LDEYADAIEQAQADILAAAVDIAALELTGSPDVVYTDAFPELSPVVLHGADTLTGGSPAGTWTAVLGFSGAVATLDTTNKTTGTGSISADLSLPASGVSDLHCNLTTPVAVGAHTAVSFDVRYSNPVGATVELGYRLVIASAADLGGTTATVAMNPTANLAGAGGWATISVPVGAVTSIASFGIQRWAGSGTSTRHITWNIDNPSLGGETSVDRALASASNVGVVVSPSYSPTVTQDLLSLGTTKSILSFVPGRENLSNFRGVRNIRDKAMDETGTKDVTTDILAIQAEAAPGDMIEFPPNAILKVGGQIDLSKPGIQWEMRGARFVVPSYGDGVRTFNLLGEGVAVRGARVFGSSGSTLFNGSLMTTIVGATTSGTTKLLTNANDEARVPTFQGTGFTSYYARDHLGYCQVDLDLSQATPVAGNVIVTVKNPNDLAEVAYTTTLTVTNTRTTYPIRWQPANIWARSMITVKKVTSTVGNPVIVHSYRTYRTPDYADGTALCHAFQISGARCVLEDWWAEGVGGDGVTFISDASGYGSRASQGGSRAVSRQGVSVVEGHSGILEDFISIGAARSGIDIEPIGQDGDPPRITDFTIRRGMIGNGGTGALASIGQDRIFRVHFHDVTFHIDGGSQPQFRLGDSDIRNLTFVTDDPTRPINIQLWGLDSEYSDIVCDGPIELGGTNNRLDRATVTKVVQTGSLIVTGTKHHIGYVKIGDSSAFTIDTALTFNPVQLALDTTYDQIEMPEWRDEFGNTFRWNIATGQPWYPRGLDMLQQGVRGLRGISGTSVPSNNVAGTAAVTAAATTATVAFPARSDVLQAGDFTLSGSGPQTTRLQTESQVGGPNVGTWTITYQGQTTTPIAAEANLATIQAALEALSNLVPGDVVASGGPTITGNNGVTLTWAAAIGDLPETLTTTTSIISAKGNLMSVDVTQVVTGGFLTPGAYWYRVAGRSFEGQPVAARAAKQITLSGQNAVSISTAVPRYSTTSDLQLSGLTIWRTAAGGISAGPYVARFDVVPTTDFHRPGSAVDRGTNASGFPVQVVNVTGTELNTDMSGWEYDTNYRVWVTPSWPTPVAVTAKRIGGFDITFGVACPTGNGTFDWGLSR
jgi:hypothetical protein